MLICAKIEVEEPFRLIIVDSIMALFRVDFSGRGKLSERQQKVGQMMSKLQKLAEEFNVAVFITNHGNHNHDPNAFMLQATIILWLLLPPLTF